MNRHLPRSFPRHLALLPGFFAIAALTLVGCQNAKENEKPTIVPIPEQSFNQTWSNSLALAKGDYVTRLYVRDDAIHLYTAQHYDHALKRSDGELLFFNPVAGPDTDLHGGPVVLSDRIVIPTTYTMEVYKKNGDALRSVNNHELNFTVTSGAVGMGSMVYIGTDHHGGSLSALDVGKPYNVVRWELLANGAVQGAPTAFGGDVYYGSDDGSVRACDDSGHGIWPLLDEGRFKTGDKILADLKADKYGVYVASTDGRLYVINRENGKLKWQYFAGNSLTTAPEITDKLVYQYVAGRGIVVIQKTRKLDLGIDNKQLDEDPIHSPLWIATDALRLLAEDDKYSYLLGTDNRIQARDRQTGALVFKSQRNDFAAYGTNTKDGIVYAATRDGFVIAAQPVLKPGVSGHLVLNIDSIYPTAAVATAQ